MTVPFTIVADENIPGEVVIALRQNGHRVYWIAAEKPGIPDTDVWDIAASKGALLLTKDKGYLSQLTKDQILNGPRVLVFKASGTQQDELRSSEVLTQFASWYLRECCEKDWHYVTVAIEGKHRSRKQCWGDEQLRKKRV